MTMPKATLTTEGCRSAEAAQLVVDGLRARLRPAYSLPDGVFQLNASIGIACYPTDSSDPEALLAHAAGPDAPAASRIHAGMLGRCGM